MLPIYYINLDQRTDRRAFMEQQLDALGLSATRISAVSASTLPTRTEEAERPGRTPRLTRSQLACTKSHVLCWRALLETDAAWGLVLEDDVLISAGLPEFLSAFPHSAAAGSLDLIQLEACARRARVLPVAARVGRTGLRPFCSTQWGAAGYLVSARGATALVESKELFDAPTDQVLFRPYAGPGRSMRMSLADPALFVQVDKVEATELARGNLTPVQAGTSPLRALARLPRDLWSFAASVAYHVRHLPKGVTSEVIAFDTPGRRFHGSRLQGHGTEI